jgi:predicted dehydrogenase
VTQKPLGFGLIGCGDISPRHAATLKGMENATLVACTDVVAASAQRLAEEHNIPAAPSLEALLAMPEVDAVTIATPAFTHLPIVEAAAKAGKAIICEKPLAANLEDARRIIDICREHNVPLGTYFFVRYNHGSLWVKKLIAEGALGRIVSFLLRDLSFKADLYWTGGYSQRTKDDWRKSKARSGGGVVITNLVHHLDAVRSIAGAEVKRVYAEVDNLTTPEVEVEDLAYAVLRYDNEAIGAAEGYSNLAGEFDSPWPITIMGTKGQARLGPWDDRCQVYLVDGAEGIPAKEWVKHEDRVIGRAGLYDDFIAAVRAGTPPPSSGEDGYRALEIVTAIYRSAEQRQPVTLPLD